MYKVFAFLKRNPNLTHDEYRAGHVGYHCGQSRRLKNIRGYLVNVWANDPLEEKLGPTLGTEIRKLDIDLVVRESLGYLLSELGAGEDLQCVGQDVGQLALRIARS